MFAFYNHSLPPTIIALELTQNISKPRIVPWMIWLDSTKSGLNFRFPSLFLYHIQSFHTIDNNFRGAKYSQLPPIRLNSQSFNHHSAKNFALRSPLYAGPFCRASLSRFITNGVLSYNGRDSNSSTLITSVQMFCACKRRSFKLSRIWNREEYFQHHHSRQARVEKSTRIRRGGSLLS